MKEQGRLSNLSGHTSPTPVTVAGQIGGLSFSLLFMGPTNKTNLMSRWINPLFFQTIIFLTILFLVLNTVLFEPKHPFPLWCWCLDGFALSFLSSIPNLFSSFFYLNYIFWHPFALGVWTGALLSFAPSVLLSTHSLFSPFFADNRTGILFLLNHSPFSICIWYSVICSLWMWVVGNALWFGLLILSCHLFILSFCHPFSIYVM